MTLINTTFCVAGLVLGYGIAYLQYRVRGR